MDAVAGARIVHVRSHRLLRAGRRAILYHMAFSLEIRCTACKRLALARMEPVYEDFKKVGETFVCSACGHRYPARDKTPFVDAEGRPRVFTETDKPAVAKVFKSDERRRSCAWCRHFIVNPFRQRCGLNNREVEATDICGRFLPKPDLAKETGGGTSGAGSRFEALFGEVEKPAPVAPVAQVAPIAEPVAPVVPVPVLPVVPPVVAPPPVPPVEAPVQKEIKPPAVPVPAERVPKKAPAKKRVVAAVDAPVKKAPAKKKAAGPAAKPAKETPAKRPVGRPRKPKAE